MKGTQAVFGAYNGRSAAAFWVDGKLDDLLVDPAEDTIRPGTIYRARAKRPMKGQGGVIFETPDGQLFLRSAKGVSAGDTRLVQVSSYAEPGKASPCTERLTFKSRFCLITPGAVGRNISKAIRNEERRVVLHELLETISMPKGIGLVLRTSAEDANEAAILDDINTFLELSTSLLSEPREGAPEKLLDGPSAQDLAYRDWPIPDATETGENAFDVTGTIDAIEALSGGREALPGGGFFFVEPTRALVSVDVNTGRDTSPASGLKATIETLRNLPRALRLRGLGGQIVIDPAPVPKKDRKQVESVLRAAFRADPVETTFVGWTPLGHLEMIRKRERPPLWEFS